MKQFQVIWSQEALDDVTGLWFAAPSELRSAINAAWRAIDDTVAHGPENIGESRPDGRRIWFEFPLGVVFKVDPEKKELDILQVWTFKKRT